ncbi:uncharacterized protein CcaverHIS019_0405640 [Cutaneotrichosporon cavernicola]|uniref:COP9 signalosome complex subunit 6 n=1 Tax=Cutaneotrichosporon cavernicola TaxID=279322 RepID=A0AA48L4D1_9TREE|nr:uncharacterized protein CcaverHIS019_0405640 [Cutaneotrichosporon cavernicola]BEI91744.1 hypothetical protein CcaverHIS019_0405640 [Cutaneotrichosporon cavernicola]
MDKNSVVAESGANSGLTINLHPLAILNISDHYTRVKCTGSTAKMLGAILGTQNGRDVSMQNSFELTLDESDSTKFDAAFLATRHELFSQTFPTLSVVGWYTIGAAPTPGDVAIHEQFINANESGPSFFVLFNPDIPDGAKTLPFSVYEAALEGESSAGKFVRLECGIETGEAERIAVDGVIKDASGEADQTGEVTSLTMQRNAIAMLYDRALVLLKYVSGVVDGWLQTRKLLITAGTAKPDHDILRQISALVATLPVMDVNELHTELETEYNDVQLTTYLTTLLQQLEAFADYTDKHLSLHARDSDDVSLAARALKASFGYSNSGGHGRMRRGSRR